MPRKLLAAAGCAAKSFFNEAMSTAPQRRWFRFSLRTMFVAFTVVAVWLGWNVRVVQQRKAKLAELEADDFRVVVTTRARWETLYNNVLGLPMPEAPPIRRLLGDEPVYRMMFLPLWGASDAEFNAAADLFPEAIVEAWWREKREPSR